MGLMNNCMNPYGGVNPLIDKMIGNAYDIVKYVARYLKDIRYVAENMATVYAAVNGTRTMLTAVADGLSSTLTVAMPVDFDYTTLRTVNVMAIYEGSTVTFPGPDTFEYVIANDVMTINLHSVLPQVALATYHIALTTEPAV
jgi:hypothetical protein